MPLRDVMGAAPRSRLPHIVAPDVSTESGKVLETERRMFSLRDADNQNPYSWDFDLCSLTLGNFNYRKMTLVRDFANLIETDMASGALRCRSARQGAFTCVRGRPGCSFTDTPC